MRQIIYISTATAVTTPEDPAAILEVSRRNNVRDGLTGLLYFDGKRFLQVIEGDDATIAGTLDRINHDPRHRAIVVLADRHVSEREFGEWSMAYRAPGAEAAPFLQRIADLVANASPMVQSTFNSFAEVRRAA